MILQSLPDFLKVSQIRRIEDGHLDTVITGGFEFLQDWKFTFDEMRRPQQQIKAYFHMVRMREPSLPLRRSASSMALQKHSNAYNGEIT